MKIIYIQECLDQKDLTPVERSLVEFTEEEYVLNSWWNNKKELLGSQPQLFLPEEVLRECTNPDMMMRNKTFINLYARSLGIKPESGFQEEVKKILENSHRKEDLLNIGWSPILEYNEYNKKLSSLRLNSIMESLMHCKFIDLSNTPAQLTEQEIGFHKPHGITITYIKEMRPNINDEPKPKIFIRMTQNPDQTFPLTYGKLMGIRRISEILPQFHEPFVTKLFTPVHPELLEKIRADNNIDRFNNDSIISKVLSRLTGPNMMYPQVSNIRLFTQNLIDNLLPNFNHNDIYSRPNMEYPVNVLYHGFSPTYQDLAQSNTKLKVYYDFDNLLESTLFNNTMKMITEDMKFKRIDFDKEKVTWGDFVSLFKN